MELSVQEAQLKQLIKNALVEILDERQDLFVEIIREAMEDFALGKAIHEGIDNDPVSRDDIFNVLSE